MSQVAIVCGAADDVCAAAAMRLARDGMDIAVLCAKPDVGAEAGVGAEPCAGAQLAARVAETGRRSIAIEADIADADSMETALAGISTALGDPSVLLHGISLAACRPLHQFSTDDWRAMTNGPLRAVFLTSRAVLDPMLQNGAGHIITIAAPTGPSHENLTLRAALGGFTMTIAMELGTFGITANLIVPASGTIGMPLPTNIDGTGGVRTGVYPTYAADAAATLPFLIGDTASAMSGQIICLGE